MKTITNKNFINFIKFHDKEFDKKYEKKKLKENIKENSNIINNFEKSIEDLENSLEKRINDKTYNKDYPIFSQYDFYYRSYITSTKYKFIDLSTGLISCINSSSFGSALTLSRFILEHVAMLSLKIDRFEELLNKRNFVKLFKEIIFLDTEDYRSKYVSDYKRTHVNDALRHYDKKFPLKNSSIFTIYNQISERVHPSPSSFLMYQTLSVLDGHSLQKSYSYNSEFIKDIIYSYIAFMCLHIEGIVNEFYPEVEKVFSTSLNKSKDLIELYFRNNLKANEDIIKFLEQYNGKKLV